ncbi:MAG: methyl-accepting chemotaxis protein [Candidatus Eremiobacterota bacterium]
MISLKWQLMIFSVLLVILPVIVLSSTGYFSMKKENFTQVEDNITQQTLLIKDYLEGEYKTLINKFNGDLITARNSILSDGEPVIDEKDRASIVAVDQHTRKETAMFVPVMKINGTKISYNYDRVDTVQKLTGDTCTIYQLIPQGLLIVSTNLLNQEGKRAINTLVPKDSPVYETIMKGEKFSGIAYMVNGWYFVACEPLKDNSGKIVGAINVGLKSQEVQNKMLDTVSKIVVGKTGYIFILDAQNDPNERGKYILSLQRKRDGENIWDAKDSRGDYFVQDMINKTSALPENKVYIKYYPWKNTGENSARMKIAACVYVPHWQWLLASSSYEDDFTEALARFKTGAIMLAVITIVCGLLIAYVIALIISTPFNRMVNIFSKVASGDLTEKVNLKTNISELQKLSDSCDRMINSVKNTISMISMLSTSLGSSMGMDQLNNISKELVGLVKEYKVE